jgi:hypothetical protein
MPSPSPSGPSPGDGLLTMPESIQKDGNEHQPMFSCNADSTLYLERGDLNEGSDVSTDMRGSSVSSDVDGATVGTLVDHYNKAADIAARPLVLPHYPPTDVSNVSDISNVSSNVSNVSSNVSSDSSKSRNIFSVLANVEKYVYRSTPPQSSTFTMPFRHLCYERGF